MAVATNERITGQVVAVLGNREVLIDRGFDDGVEIGMRFVILGEPKEVPLPDSNSSITLRLPKTVVKVVRFEGANASVGRTFLTIKGSPGLAQLASGTPDRIETFNYDKKEALLPDDEQVVRRGDPVRQTVGDEYLDMR